MAQAPLTTAKMFTASWTERDEAVLVELLQRKIKELKYDIKECDSPYARAKLKSKREEYKRLLDKVERSDYDPNILANELRTHANFNTIQREKREKSLGRYVDAYSDVNFDFESYFSKTRYFGASAPVVMIILIVIFIAALLCSTFLPIDTINTVEENLQGDMRLTLTSIGYFKLGENELDFQVTNDGNWPKGTYADPEEAYAQGEIYFVPETGYQPEKVWLYSDLNMTSIDITVMDVIKALFRTPMFSENRVDVIENLDAMQGKSWYYLRYMRDRADDIKIEKGEDGKYNNVAIVKHIATYGTILFLVLTILLCAVELVLNIGRLFSYTSRRIHVIPLFIVICGALTLLCPAFLEIEALTGDAVSTALSNYFTMYWEDFLFGSDGAILICFNLLFAAMMIIPFLLVFLPLFFHNKAAKTVAYVPKGNRAHTYPGQDEPTKAGQPGDAKAEKKSKGKIAKAGSRSPSSTRYPAR